MKSTIRHDDTGQSITAYLALHDRPVRVSRIVAYMQLMHYVSPTNVRTTLPRLIRDHVITHIQRGWYTQ